MMIKRGDAKTGTVIEASSAKESSVCPSCGRILPAAVGDAGAKCPCETASCETVSCEKTGESA